MHPFLIIGNYLQKHPIGKLYHAPFDVYLDEINAFQPDLLFVARANHILTEAGAQGAPEFIVEILSPETAGLDKNAKRHVYARSGVRELWLVDPDARRIDVYDLRKNPERPVATHSEESTFTSPHFPGLKFKGARVFQA